MLGDVRQVYLASASPPVRFPNVYGVDMPTRKEFVACDLDEEQIRQVCAAHSLMLAICMDCSDII